MDAQTFKKNCKEIITAVNKSDYFIDKTKIKITAKDNAEVLLSKLDDAISDDAPDEYKAAFDELVRIYIDNNDSFDESTTLDTPIDDAPPVAQPVQQPVAQLVRQPVQQQVAQPAQQLVRQPVQQPVAQPVQQPVAQLVQQPVAQPVQQPVQQPVAQPVQQPSKRAKREIKQQPTKDTQQASVDYEFVINDLYSQVPPENLNNLQHTTLLFLLKTQTKQKD